MNMNFKNEQTCGLENHTPTEAMLSLEVAASRLPLNGEDAGEWQRVATKAERRKEMSISDFPGVLRLPRRNYDVPTFDQLFKAEKLYLLRSFGFGCIETAGQDPINIIKLVISKYGSCKYFKALMCSLVDKRIMRRLARARKAREHKERQHVWFDLGGRESHYVAKHKYGCLDHWWFVRRLEKATGMVVNDTLVAGTSYDNSPASPPTTPRKRWNRTSFSSDLAQSASDSALLLPPPPPPVRSVMLLTKLRAYIRALRSAPMSRWNAPLVQLKEKAPKYRRWTVGAPQMEGRTGEDLGTIRTENVVLTEENPGSSAVASTARFSFNWHQLCSSDKTPDYSQVLDRFTYFKCVDWTTAATANTELTSLKMDLPYDFVNSVSTAGTMPMFVPFKIYKYFKSDIEIKIHVNSNKFQVGQLQIAWQYMEKFDANKLDNMYSRSQLPHVLINAGASNEATLYIPYRFVQPYMHTSQRKKAIDCLYLGSLRCFVVAPLAVAEKGPTSCGVSVFIRFPNSQFTGLRDGGIADPQMEGAAAAMVASAAYDKFIGDRNCDNPSQNTNPNYLVPTASHSWCAGKGLPEKLHSLRLDNTVVGVGRPEISPSETSIGIPCRTFGMLKSFEWSSSDKEKNKPGYLLWSADVHGQVEKSLVYSITSTSELDTYAFPPVSVITGLYQWWRGSLEFRFDIIASQFHTGRLLCAYIPGFYGSASAITLEQARNSPYIEFSLQDATSFTFTVPYISNSVWWPRRYTGPHKYSENSSPSKIVLFVLNPLIIMESIIPKVVIVPYMRAGSDFEVAVPVQPAIGLSDCTVTTVRMKDFIYPTSGSYPMYATNYEGFGEDNYYIFYEGSAALGTACTFHGPEKTLSKKEYVYGKFVNATSVGTMTYKTKKTDQETTNYIGYIVLWGTEKGNYGIPFPATDEGKDYASKLASYLRLEKSEADCLTCCYKYINDGSKSSSDITKLKATPVYGKIDSVEDFTIIEPQMDPRYEVENNLMPTNSLPSTSSGSFNFNEKFDDLKDLARRYQLYASNKVSLPSGYETGEALAVFPCIPHGLDLDVDKYSSIFNTCRDGHIPIISSGYIYFRGSLRFRLVFHSDDIILSAAKIWVQHHPDGDCTKHKVQVYPKIEEEDGFKSHTYSYYVQNASVNSIIEFEVPFYQHGMYGLTRKMNSSTAENVCQYYSLGNIVVGLNCGVLSRKVDIGMQVYYSVGDDFSFNDFRGFPMMVATDEVWPPSEKKTRNKKITWITAEPQMEPPTEAEPQMFRKMADAYNTITQPKQAVVGCINGIAAEIASELKKTVSEIGVNIVDIDTKFAMQFNYNAVMSAIGNIAHVLNNPTPATIAISVANIIIAVFGTYIVNSIYMIKKMTELVTATWHLFTKSDSDVGSPQGDFGPSAEQSLGGIIFAGVCGMLGVTIASPTKFPGLLRDINSGVSLTNNVIRLIQNCNELILWCFRWVSGKIYPDLALKALLYNDIPEIKQWFQECSFLLDARNKDRYLYDRSMMSRVFDACVVGSILVSQGFDESVRGGKIVCDMFKEMKKLRNDLVERGVHPDVRFETFPLWMSGAPGIGKSFMVKRLINDLLKSINYTSPGSLIYDIPSGAKYWSGCQNPAALVSDDIFQVTGTKREEEMANLFMICSSSVLNPPMAAVEDKERRINPLIYMMLCNSHFPAIDTSVACPEAVYRRRKFLIYADFADHIKENYPDILDAGRLPREELADLKHLKFRYALNPKNKDTQYTEWMSYADLLAVIGEDFKRHYENERQNFRQRMIDMYCLDPNFNERNIIMEMPQLEELMSLRERREAFNQHIRTQLDQYEDPNREPFVADYIRKFVDRVKSLWPARPQMIPASLATSALCMDDNGASKLGTYSSESLIDIILKQESKMMSGKLMVQQLFVEENYPEIYDEIFQVHSKFTRTFSQFDIFDTQNFSAANMANLPYTFIGCLSYGTSNSLTLLLHQYMDKFLVRSVGDMARQQWFYNSIDKLLKVGEFDELDIMRFFCIFKGGAKDMARLLFNYNSDPTQVLPVDAEAQTINAHTPYFRGGAVLKKECIRDAMEELKQEDWKESRKEFYQEAYEYYTAERTHRTVDIDPEISFLLKNLYNNIGDIGKVLEIFLQKHYTNPKADKGDIKSLLRFIISMYGVALFSEVIFGDVHTCNKSLGMALRRPRLCNYCSINDSIKFDDKVVIKNCVNKRCIYTSRFGYYFAALLSVNCFNIRDTDNSTWEIDDIFRAVRRRNKDRIHNTLSKMGDWLQCFITHKIPHYVTKFLAFIVERLPIILSIAGAVLVTMGIKKYTGVEADASISWNIFKPSGSSGGPQGNYFKFNSPKHPKKPESKPAPKAFAKPEMNCTSRALMGQLIERNTVILYATWIEDGKRMCRQCRNLMLKGRAMLVIRHYLEEFRAMVEDEGHDVEFKLFYGTKTGVVANTSLRYEHLQRVAWCSSSEDRVTSNYGIVMLPNFVPQFKDITGRFATSSEHANAPSMGDLYVVNGDSSFNMAINRKKNFVVGATDNSERVYLDIAYSYNMQYQGLCGSALVAPTLGSGMGAIIGFHVAGSSHTGLGYSEPVYRELFDAFFNDNPQPTVMEIPLDPSVRPDFELDANLMMYGCVPPTYAHKESGKSKIIPSLLANKIYPTRTEVNPLRPNDPRQPPGSHPLRDGCLKHGSGEVKAYDQKDVDKVKEHMSDRISQIIRPIRNEVRPLTMQQAVCGDVNVPYFEPLNWKSSEGFPLSTLRPSGAHDKRWLFKLTEGQFGYQLDGLHPKLEMQMSLRDKCFEKGIKPPTVYVDCLKDYRLTPEKCKQPGKTRIFSIAPIQCSLDMRMYINDFTASLKNSRIKNSIGIGINPDSIEWTQLVNYLFEVGNKIITLDYKNFGPTLMSQLVAAGNEVIVDWFKYHNASEEHVRRVAWLLDSDILNPVHLSSNVVYQTLNGIASGSPLTGECNSIPNLFYIRLTYLEIMKEHQDEFANMYWFEQFVRIVVYGDDLIMSVSDEIAELFNAITIRDYLAKHGIQVTPAQKDSEMVPYTDIYGASFLKRSFKEHPFRAGIWLGPIEQASIEECINWVHVSDNIQEATLESCRASLDLAYSQGPLYYKEHYEKIKRALNEIGMTIECKDWHTRDNEIFSDEAQSTVEKISVKIPWYYKLGEESL